MTDYKHKLKKLAAQPYWKRLAFTLVVNALYGAGVLIDFYLYLNYYFPRRRFSLRRHPRGHYLGYPRQHPHRAAFAALGIVVVATATQLPDRTASMHWVIAWGTLFSAWVILASLNVLRKATKNNR